MAMEKSIHLRVTDDEIKAIEDERQRLAEQGIRVSKSGAVRSLIFQASTVTDKLGGKPVKISSKGFKPK